MSSESHSLGLERKLGGKFHLTFVIGLRLVAYKYHEGNVKRTLERELKVPELAERELNGISESAIGLSVLHLRSWVLGPLPLAGACMNF